MRARGMSLVNVAMAVTAVGILTAFGFRTAAASYNEFRLNDCKVKLSKMRQAISMYRYRYYRNQLSFSPAPSAYGWPTVATLNANSYTYTDGVAKTIDVFPGGVPVEPFSGSTAFTSTNDGTGGWYFNDATGLLRANLLSAEYGPTGTKLRLSEWIWNW